MISDFSTTPILPNNRVLKIEDPSTDFNFVTWNPSQYQISCYHNGKNIILTDKVEFYQNNSINVGACKIQSIQGKTIATAEREVYGMYFKLDKII